jgi:hypothetical protein
VSGLRAAAIRSAIKIHLLHLVGILFPHIIEDARSKPHQKCLLITQLYCNAVNVTVTVLSINLSASYAAACLLLFFSVEFIENTSSYNLI